MKLTLLSYLSSPLNSSFRYLYEEDIGIAHLNALGGGHYKCNRLIPREMV